MKRKLALATIGFFLYAAVGFGLLLTALSAQADSVYQGSNVMVRFRDTPCANSDLKAILTLQTGGDAFVANAFWPDGLREACWARDKDGDYLIIDETGAMGYVPKGEVRPAEPTT